MKSKKTAAGHNIERFGRGASHVLLSASCVYGIPVELVNVRSRGIMKSEPHHDTLYIMAHSLQCDLVWPVLLITK